MIVKVQRPLAGEVGEALVYDERRDFNAFVPMTTELRRLFGGRLKFYCEAELVGRDLVVGRVVPDCDW